MIIKFPREYLVEELGLPHEPDTDKVRVLMNRIEDQSRWITIYRLVFEILESEKIYETYYDVGSTEMQEEEPWEEQEEVDCLEVKPTQVQVVEYVPI